MTVSIQVSVNLVAAAQKSRGPLGKLSVEVLEVLDRRYRMFLQLCKKYPRMHMSPTGDIDEMWHLHMLHPKAYYHDCIRNFGCILDHNPGFGLASDAEWAQLKVQFGAVESLWAEEFGESYVLAKTPLTQAGMTVCESSDMTVCESVPDFRAGMTVCESDALMMTSSSHSAALAQLGIVPGQIVCESDAMRAEFVQETEVA